MQVPKWISALLLGAALLCRPVPALSQTPQAWLAPMAPGLWPDGRNGATDYMSLFTPSAPWAGASSHVQIFKIYNSQFEGGLPGALSDNDWRLVFADLTRRNIALAVEWGPLTDLTCGTGVEGFEGTDAGNLARKIQSLGGNLRYIAMDEPFYYGTVYGGAGACGWTAQQVAQNAVNAIARIKTIFPNVIVGDIEPVLDDSGLLDRYAAWADTWKLVAGSPLAFFHCDVDWTGNWMANVEKMRQALAARSIPFGMIYNGFWADDGDASWVGDAEAHFITYELHGGVTPAHVIFQTWDPHPTHVLPESDPSALTYLVARYFRSRTSLSVSSGPASAAGRLQDSLGNPVAFATVSLSLQDGFQQGSVKTYTLSGTVPTGITSAVVQICVNECGSRGANNMNVYGFQYADSGAKTSLAVSDGVAAWEIEPPPGGTASVQVVTGPAGASLAIQSTAAQQRYVNSPPFPVTPGGSFVLTAQARISADSVNSGAFVLIFLKGQEVSRLTLPFTPDAPLGKTQTAGDGTYSLQFAPPPAGTVQLHVSYEGSNQLWPAVKSTQILDDSPSIQTNGIVNAANFQPEVLSPGAWFSIFGRNLGSLAQWTDARTLSLGGASVDVCGVPAVLSYNSGPVMTGGSVRWQVNALTPDGIGPATCPVVVRVNGRSSPAANIQVAAGRMELFQFTASAGPLPVITHLDYSYVGPVSGGLVPATPGEILSAWGTGDCSVPVMSVAGAPAAVVYSGRVAPGLCQINFIVPSGVTGNSLLGISTSPAAYTLWVR